MLQLVFCQLSPHIVLTFFSQNCSGNNLQSFIVFYSSMYVTHVLKSNTWREWVLDKSASCFTSDTSSSFRLERSLSGLCTFYENMSASFKSYNLHKAKCSSMWTSTPFSEMESKTGEFQEAHGQANLEFIATNNEETLSQIRWKVKTHLGLSSVLHLFTIALLCSLQREITSTWAINSYTLFFFLHDLLIHSSITSRQICMHVCACTWMCMCMWDMYPYMWLDMAIWSYIPVWIISNTFL